MLRLLVDLVEASCFSENPEWSPDEQVAKDIQLLDMLAEKQAQVFSEECKLFPADVQIQSNFPVPDISDLESRLSDHMKHLADLQQVVNDLATKQSYNPNEEHEDAELELRLQLESFLETAKAFDLIYTKEIRPWTSTMELPQLHGLGPAAHRLLESYKSLLKLLRNLRNIRDSHAAVAAISEVAGDEDSSTTAAESPSLETLVSECESALTELNHGLGILSASRARYATS
ncbi:hypothetical protein O6H91_17G079300 [Diphasiastrum complanatum]|nr:hypothetical protein O6H91_17G079300 [Diphasiastrum complanatum]